MSWDPRKENASRHHNTIYIDLLGPFPLPNTFMSGLSHSGLRHLSCNGPWFLTSCLLVVSILFFTWQPKECLTM